MKNKKLIIIGTLLIAILAMSVGYASLATTISLDGTTEITGTWDIKITNVEVVKVSDGCTAGEPSFTDNTVSFAATLNKPGDEVDYRITIANAGTIDAELDKVVFDIEQNDVKEIVYQVTSPADELPAGETTTFVVNVIFDKDITEIPSSKTRKINGTINYVQK